MSISIESFATPHQRLDPSNATISSDQLTDTNGASGRSTTTHSQTIPAFGGAQPVSNSVDIVASNVIEMTLDASRMGLTLTQPISATLDLSHIVNLRLRGLSEQVISWQQFDSSNELISQGESVIEGGEHLIKLVASATGLSIQ